MASARGPIVCRTNSSRLLNIRLRFCGWMFRLSTKRRYRALRSTGSSVCAAGESRATTVPSSSSTLPPETE